MNSNDEIINGIKKESVLNVLDNVNKGFKSKIELLSIFDISYKELTNILLGLKRKSYIKMFRWYGNDEMYYGVTVNGSIFLREN
ncbi:hypothetical protein SDC9_30483 [bioreactor metagenome]|uniref:Uncharacterized protein n=1 Tax=bioreactor metagenome TaxID=1076179 RepID=A0A644UZL7_9ZZZZ|nr:hypothetical protein [Methanobrevibacter sp.]MEA4957582.1 hypothetical protein [Methanobrevibacter sp.]